MTARQEGRFGRGDSTPEGQQLRQPILSLLPRGPGGGHSSCRCDWCPLHTQPNMLVSVASCCPSSTTSTYSSEGQKLHV